MPDDARGGNGEPVIKGDGEPVVKVVDRRRFRLDEGSADPERSAAEQEIQAGSQPSQAEPSGSQAELQAKVAEQAARIDELTRAYAALVEDNKAFRARMEREKERVVEADRAWVAQALLDAADELERALSAVSATAPGEQGGMLATLAEGVRITLAGLAKRIGELGARRLEVVGQPFDPRVAEAVDAVPVADAAQDGIVLQEVRPGYRIGDRILRPARVRVGRLARA